jgi:adenylate cyclase
MLCRAVLTEMDSSRDQLLFQLGAELASSLDLDEVLGNLMNRVVEFMRASRGFIVLVDEAGEISVQMAKGATPHEDTNEFVGSRTVIEQVVADGKAVLATDATVDDRFKGQQSVILQNLRSIVAAPLVVKGKVIGALYVDNPFRAGIFDNDDKQFLQAIAYQAASAIDNARLYTQLKSNYEHAEFMRQTFERYVNKQVMERVLADPNGGFLAGERLRVTMLASDIAGFSTLSQELEAEDMVALLNDYFGRMVDIVLAHGGNVDKFQGDGLLAVFGAPAPLEDSAQRAVSAAREMVVEIAAMNAQRVKMGDLPIEVGIGLDTGYVVAGNIGSERRLDYTLIGVPVNNAAYLCNMRPPDVLISQNTFRALHGKVEAVPREPIVLKGGTRPAHIYSLK